MAAKDAALLDFVVRLATVDSFRAQYQQADQAGRKAMLESAGVSPAGVAAMQESKAGAVEILIENTQVVGGRP